MTIHTPLSPTINNKKNYLVIDGKLTRAGWNFLKQFNKKDSKDNK